MPFSDKEYWLGQHMVKNTTSSVTSSYLYVPYIPPTDNSTQPDVET